jgi:hypothetical protein
MKLLRWAAAGATAYAIYRYSIGKKAKGEDVFVTPERAIADLTESKQPPKPKRPRTPRKKPPAKGNTIG